MRGYVVELPDFYASDCPAFLSKFYIFEFPLWHYVSASVRVSLVFRNYLSARFWAIKIPYRCFVRYINFK